MKNVFRLIGVAVVATVIGFSFITCLELDDGSDDENTLTPPVFTVTPYARDAIQISIESFPGAIGYNLYSSMFSYGTFTPRYFEVVSTASVVTFVYYGRRVPLIPDTTYYFKLSAIFRSGEGPQSPVQSAKTYGPDYPAVPEAPTDVTAAPESSTSIKVSWTAVDDVDWYDVYRALPNRNSFLKVNTEPITDSFFVDKGESLTPPGLTEEGDYRYWVVAVITVPKDGRTIWGLTSVTVTARLQ